MIADLERKQCIQQSTRQSVLTMQNIFIYYIEIACYIGYNLSTLIRKGYFIMSTTNINVRIDSELKKSAEELFNDLGLNMSAAITMFLKSAVSHDGIPFEVKRISPNAETKAALAEYDEMKKNPNKYKRYSSFNDLMDEVLADA
jgi:DNA-damage-inducible protein J